MSAEATLNAIVLGLLTPAGIGTVAGLYLTGALGRTRTHCPETRNGWHCILPGPHPVTRDGRARHYFVKETR